eukprot:1215897-Rhodomonas_salina.1
MAVELQVQHLDLLPDRETERERERERHSSVQTRVQTRGGAILPLAPARAAGGHSRASATNNERARERGGRRARGGERPAGQA